MKLEDKQYTGLPWKDGGRSRAGVDCVGLAWLWLKEQAGLTAPAPDSRPDADAEKVLQLGFNEKALKRGTVVFFRVKENGKVRHVAIYLGEGKYLHIVRGAESRIDTGLKLLKRMGCEPVAAVSPDQSEKLCLALRDQNIGDPGTLILIAVAGVLAVASYFLTPSLSGFKNRNGRYGDGALVTQKNPEIPLPDILGKLMVAGNSVYQELPDKNGATSQPQKWNQIIVLASGPAEEIETAGLNINGVSYQDKSFFDGTNVEGIFVNPEQTKAAAVSGTIGSDSDVPTVTLYDGAHGITVPVDIRAQYDRGFPIYGFSGCAYLAFRFADSSKFTNLNITQRGQWRKCRTFDGDGFTVLTATGESLSGADGTKVRFKLAFEDIVSISSITVNATSFAEISASAQTGNKYSLNRLKGYVEFITAPLAAATITVTYTYYEREWTANPANHIIYELTESVRGKGIPADRISWEDAEDARDYFDETVTWVSGSATYSTPRYETHYSIDYRKPIQDHLQALLDACNSMLFLSNGKFVLRARKSESSVFTFDSSNIMLDENGDSTFVATLTDRSQKPNRLKLFFHSEDTLNAETEAAAEDEKNQQDRAARLGNNGVLDENLKLPAVTSISQAERIGEMVLRERLESNWLYRWKTNIQGLALQPGDVVEVEHASLPTGASLLRIDTIEHDENDRLVFSAFEYVPSAYI